MAPKSKKHPKPSDSYLPPVNPALGIDLAFCIATQTTLKIEKSAWKNHIHVMGQDHKEWVHWNGKKFTGPYNRTLFHLWTADGKFIGEGPDGEQLFTVKPKGNYMWANIKLKAKFRNAASTNEEVTLRVHRNKIYLESQVGRKIKKEVVAKITPHSANAKQTYHVSVAPWVDLSLIAALCVCFDGKVVHKEVTWIGAIAIGTAVVLAALKTQLDDNSHSQDKQPIFAKPRFSFFGGY